MELSDSNIKKFIIFFHEKAFVIFRETETSKKFFIFQETKLPCVSGNETFLYFRKRNFLLFS